MVGLLNVNDTAQIPPVCKDDLVILPPAVARGFGGISPLLLCHKVLCLQVFPFRVSCYTCYITGHFPTSPRRPFHADARGTQRHAILEEAIYTSFEQYELGRQLHDQHNAALVGRSLTQFVVLDVEHASPGSINPHTQQQSTRFLLAELQVVRESDFGQNDTMFAVHSHLGHLLKPGDYVLGACLYQRGCILSRALGYDLTNLNVNSATVKAMKVSGVAVNSHRTPELSGARPS